MTALNIGGMAIAPGVVETIVTMAARDVDGVACVGQSAGNSILSRLGGKLSTQGVEADVDENDSLHISISIEVKNGYVLPDVAAKIRQAVSDAVTTQVGVQVGSVDIFIDGIQFAA